MPGRRIKLAPQDIYAYGAHRGGIDERWFASTTRPPTRTARPTRGSATSSDDGKRAFTLARRRRPGRRDARSASRSGTSTSAGRSTASSSTTSGRSRTTCTRTTQQAALVGQQGKPESYYFPPQLNALGNNFPYTFFGLEPGTTKAGHRPLPGALERGRQRHPQLLARPIACSPAPAGWCRRASCTPPARSSPTSRSGVRDVFGMYQSLVEGRPVPWACWSRTCPTEKHHDLDYLVEQLDWEANVNPSFKDSHYLEPIPWPTAAARATSIAGSSTARSTARSCSAPRN